MGRVSGAQGMWGGVGGDILAVQGAALRLAFWTMVAWLRQGDADLAGGCKLAGLAVHLHWDGFGRGEQHLSALRQPLAVPAHLQREPVGAGDSGSGAGRTTGFPFPRLENKVSNPPPDGEQR